MYPSYPRILGNKPLLNKRNVCTLVSALHVFFLATQHNACAAVTCVHPLLATSFGSATSKLWVPINVLCVIRPVLCYVQIYKNLGDPR